jgi:uncharacterized damage-inducible protein DinB
LEILSASGRVNLNKIGVPVEFVRLLKMNLGDALQFVIVHERRHALQAIAVLRRTHHTPERALKI